MSLVNEHNNKREDSSACRNVSKLNCQTTSFSEKIFMYADVKIQVGGSCKSLGNGGA